MPAKSKNQTAPTTQSVEAFVAAIPDPGQQSDARTLIRLMAEATGEPATLWGPAIVGFGSYHYRYETGREGDMPLACFSPRKSATVIYSLCRSPRFDELAPQLGKHKVSGSCLHVKRLSDVSETVLAALIQTSAAALREQHS